MPGMDALDVRLVELLSENPRVGVLELARLAGVARATVSARLERLQSSGVITGYGPTIDLAAAGYPVQAIATLEVAQGRLEDVASLLAEMPGVLEAVATTGTHDVVCRLAAASNEELQSVLLDLSRSDVIRRSTSVVVLSVLIPPRTLPLLQQERRPSPRRAPSFRG
ncbi:MAG: AsnC family transcriptional regulator [Jatrophihabitans sp.]|nr:AsnC family transcriptional regulator [Jatrophihabitans sp.]